MITLATLPMATQQEVFDQVSSHLLAQGKRCVAVDQQALITDCRYHGPDGLKCAAGCLIGEDEYDPTMERLGWGSLVKNNLVPAAHADTIILLQGIHDSRGPNEWVESLAKFARKHNLQFSPPEKAA